MKTGIVSNEETMPVFPYIYILYLMMALVLLTTCLPFNC
jgi:hypothetical protein